MSKMKFFLGLILFSTLNSCNKKDQPNPEIINEWTRDSQNPVLRDFIQNENYHSASDPHVFFDENDSLKMIYSGDENGKITIKLASGTSWNQWTATQTLLNHNLTSGIDKHKETGFYRKSNTGKHQIYYIGYTDENTYEAQIFLAEANSLKGNYTTIAQPIIPKGIIANKNVYCITSPSILEHEGLLYITFIGWDNPPNSVTEVWVMGATSSDDGHTWSNFQLVDAKIGMEGQITKVSDNEFIAVRTGEYNDKEAIFYASSSHPFGPWAESESPILVQAGPPYEKDELIAPQITIDPKTNKQYLYYTGADHQIGWWIMLAEKE